MKHLLFYRHPYYYLFYSGDGQGIEEYHIGVARSIRIMGPYEKFGREILHVNKTEYSRGKNCTFVGPGRPNRFQVQKCILNTVLYRNNQHVRVGV